VVERNGLEKEVKKGGGIIGDVKKSAIRDFLNEKRKWVKKVASAPVLRGSGKGNYHAYLGLM
jgi:hypothetical protein